MSRGHSPGVHKEPWHHPGASARRRKPASAPLLPAFWFLSLLVRMLNATDYHGGFALDVGLDSNEIVMQADKPIARPFLSRFVLMALLRSELEGWSCGAMAFSCVRWLADESAARQRCRLCCRFSGPLPTLHGAAKIREVHMKTVIDPS